MQIIKIERDWGCYPLWMIGPETADIPENLQENDLPISDSLKEMIRHWQKPVDDYLAIMDAIPGGGWSYHTDDEFQIARKSLNVEFPSPKDDLEESQEIYRGLVKELPSDQYEIQLSDMLGVEILTEAQNNK